MNVRGRITAVLAFGTVYLVSSTMNEPSSSPSSGDRRSEAEVAESIGDVLSQEYGYAATKGPFIDALYAGQSVESVVDTLKHDYKAGELSAEQYCVRVHWLADVALDVEIGLWAFENYSNDDEITANCTNWILGEGVGDFSGEVQRIADDRTACDRMMQQCYLTICAPRATGTPQGGK